MHSLQNVERSVVPKAKISSTTDVQVHKSSHGNNNNKKELELQIVNMTGCFLWLAVLDVKVEQGGAHTTASAKLVDSILWTPSSIYMFFIKFHFNTAIKQVDICPQV